MKEDLIKIDKDIEILSKVNAMEDKVIIIEVKDLEENRDTERISIKEDITITIKRISYKMNKKQLDCSLQFNCQKLRKLPNNLNQF
jgi:hypothetical protein